MAIVMRRVGMGDVVDPFDPSVPGTPGIMVQGSTTAPYKVAVADPNNPGLMIWVDAKPDAGGNLIPLSSIGPQPNNSLSSSALPIVLIALVLLFVLKR